MARTKKKRNKTYTGPDAATTTPTVRRFKAVQRNPVQQWWFEKKRFVKPILLVALIALVIIWLIVELVRIILQ